MKYFVSGHWVDSSEATIPLSDLSIGRGLALFESIRTYNGNPFRLDDHISRIIASAESSRFEAVPSREEIASIVVSGIEKNLDELGDMVVKIILTAGDGVMGKYGNCRLVARFDPVSTIEQSKYDSGIKLLSYGGPRFLAAHKNTDYFSAGLGLMEAREKGFDDIVYRDSKDRVYEISTGNLFVVKGRELITSKNDILPGITRKIVLGEIAEKLGFDVSERNLTYQELVSADEAFVTGSIKEILSVTQVDDNMIGTSCGPITHEIAAGYQEIVALEAK